MSRESIIGRNGPPPVVWALAGVFVAFELVFQFSDGAGGDLASMRWEAMRRLAFFDVLFDAALKGVPMPWHFWSSFVTYAFLHGGMLHLVMNTAIFLALGGVLARNLGAVRFLILFAVTAIGGSLVFGLMAEAQGPLVGASGAIFGFFGALKRWEWIWIRHTGASSRRLWNTIIALTAVNVLLYFGYQDATVAWQAHLGGFLAGWLIAPALAPGRAGPAPF